MITSFKYVTNCSPLVIKTGKIEIILIFSEGDLIEILGKKF